MSSAREENEMLFSRAQVSSNAKLGETITNANLCLSPIMADVATKGLSFREFSMGWGAMNFSPDVLMSSFLRSVTERYPSASIWPMSPVLNQPSSNAFWVSSGRFQYPLKTEGP